jgi:hypothetical protein
MLLLSKTSFAEVKKSMDKNLEIKIELVKRDWRHRDLAGRLRAQGFDVDTDDISRLISGRWNPPTDIRQAISEILNRPTFELFA